MHFHVILFNYQNKYLQAGIAASLFRQGGKLSPFWALTARRHRGWSPVLRDHSPAHVTSSPATSAVTTYLLIGDRLSHPS